MHSALGQWLGWLMAVIYMGGRLPQIWLNVCLKIISYLFIYSEYFFFFCSCVFYFSVR